MASHSIPRGLLHRADLAAQAGDLVNALGFAEEALRRDPWDVDILLAVGAFRGQLGDLDGAIAILQHAVALLPTPRPELHHNLGNALRERGDLDLAARQFDEALAVAPRFAPSLVGRGQVELVAGRADAAIHWFRRATRVDADYIGGWTALGDVLDAAGRPLEAIQAFTQASLRTRDPRVSRRLAVLQAVHGTPAVAIALLRGVLARDPDDGMAAHLLAALTGTVPDRPPDAFVTELFDRYADRFDAHLVDTLGYRAPEAVWHALEAACPGRIWGRVADLGCGTGLMGVRLGDRARVLSGVDLSPRMVERCAARGIYADVACGELLGWLRSPGEAFDLVLAVDVLVYVGALGPVLSAMADRLAPDGRIAFTTEVDPVAPANAFDLGPTGRYRHGPATVDAAIASAGLGLVTRSRQVLRTEGDRPIHGDVVVLTRAQTPG